MDLQEYTHVVGSIAGEFAETELHPLLLFPWSIKRMNEMYSLPINEYPTLDELGESPVDRVTGFLKTFRNEIIEGHDIQAYLIVRDLLNSGVHVSEEVIRDIVSKLNIGDPAWADKLVNGIITLVAAGDADEYDRQVLVALADWFADITVYVRSEAMKFGIPLEAVLNVVMGSNFTKLNADGSVTKDANGKVQKGPNFVAPERHIYATLFEGQELMDQAAVVHDQMNRLSAIAIPTLANPVIDIFPATGDDYEPDEFEEQDEPQANDEEFVLREKITEHEPSQDPDFGITPHAEP
jgi:hypothetical protein